MDTSRYQGDIDGLVAGSQKIVAGETLSAHTVTPTEIHTKGDRASTISTRTVIIRLELDGAIYECASWVRFVSRPERLDGSGGCEWKLL